MQLAHLLQLQLQLGSLPSIRGRHIHLALQHVIMLVLVLQCCRRIQLPLQLIVVPLCREYSLLLTLLRSQRCDRRLALSRESRRVAEVRNRVHATGATTPISAGTQCPQCGVERRQGGEPRRMRRAAAR